MATASHIELTPSTTGVYHAASISQQSCDKSSELLQKNHDNYHMYFNKNGFHNHMAHHLLTVFALGATPEEIQQAFDDNSGYQRKLQPADKKVVQDMSDRNKFKKYLDNEDYFTDYEVYFRKEIEAKGWEAVLNEHLFSRDEHANRLLVRMYSGFYHPIIHLGFGVEFKQPAIIAEALAQAATHDAWLTEFLQAAEKGASSTSSKSLFELLQATQKNEKLAKSPDWNDDNKVRDGVLGRAKNEMLEIALQVKIEPDELERKTAEMINVSAYFAGAAQRPQKQVKFDFYFIHCLNSSIFFSAFLDQPWLKPEDKCRLLEWKDRMDLVMYVSRRCPELRGDEIKNYRPKNPQDGWKEIIARVDAIHDDGHAPKLVRALAHGEQVCKPYESDDAFPVKGDMWLKLGHMAIDSVEADGPEWVRSAGFDQAWEVIPDRAKL